MNKKIFIQKLREAFEKLGISNDWGFGAALAKKYNILPQTVSAWLNPDKGYPKLEMMMRISQDTGMTIDEFVTGHSPLEKIIKASEESGVSLDELLAGRKRPKIPVITLKDAEKYNFNIAFSAQEEKLLPVLNISHPLDHPINDLIGIIHKGESMLASIGQSFPDGTIIVIDTNNKNPANGDFILAYLPDQTVIFRKYIKEEGEYLLPLNAQYPIYNDKFYIIGTLTLSLNLFIAKG